MNNCNFLTVPRVNPGIWNDLPRASRKLDVGLQEAQKSAVHTAQAIAIAVESLIRCKKEKTVRVGLEIIAGLPVRLCLSLQCFFSGLTEAQRAPEARFINEVSLCSVLRLRLCLAFFLKMS